MPDLTIFLPACLALNLAFGPNNLLAITNGARHGVLFAGKAAMGRLGVFVPMIALSALGMGLLLQMSSLAFAAVKAIGALYLIWLGVSLWRKAEASVDVGSPGPQTAGAAFRSEALVAIGNPKAILIFAAFFPQFVEPADYWAFYAVIGAVFLLLEALAALAYATAGRVASRITGGRLAWLQRGSGAAMRLFGVLLIFSPQPHAAFPAKER